ncbi:alpha/beta hydrolase [Flavobacterium sp. IMCC34852]|uniref:Alpha/beta hydrolase n=1 Tax=Flavobacterium rivulicola TaxID=2732161 RepID=A0A7Y3VZ89_9FLAO|nr:alpha/beta hydrolase [Flavobacterium sp. IMCC34852]NNT72287.1 alpha/beta hydrolase [Flavobacterium sp. IMCC34852]
MLRKILLRTIIVLLGLTLIGYIAFKVSPYPSALLIRSAFNKGGIESNKALERYVPKGIVSKLNITYDASDKDAKLDLYYPDSINSATTKLPVIVWTHGGGLISGSKEHVANYCKILASYGYMVVAIDYSVAPEAVYPTPVRQLNTALQFLTKNANLFPMDANQLFLAGDSGGSHISAQLATIVTSPDYAKATKVNPKILPHQIKGMILYCGPYETDKINTEGDFGAFMRTVLWSYSGDRNFVNNEYFKTASVLNFVTKDFPATFISVGNDDPLGYHSLALADKLDSLGVEVDRLFYPKGFAPKLPHEYQFNFETDAAKLALGKSMIFVQSKVKTPKNTTPDF